MKFKSIVFVVVGFLALYSKRRYFYDFQLYLKTKNFKASRYDPKVNNDIYELFKKLCKFEDLTACQGAATYSVRYANLEEAIKFFEMACDLGDERSCNDLDTVEQKIFLRRDIPKEKVDYIAMILDKAHEAKEVEGEFKFNAEACRLKDYESCYFASAAIEYSSITKAIEYGQKGCNGGHYKSCSFLARLYYESGKKTLAKKYYGMACSKGIETACSRLNKLKL
jgi:TPR repeat protein